VFKIKNKGLSRSPLVLPRGNYCFINSASVLPPNQLQQTIMKGN